MLVASPGALEIRPPPSAPLPPSEGSHHVGPTLGGVTQFHGPESGPSTMWGTHL